METIRKRDLCPEAYSRLAEALGLLHPGGYSGGVQSKQKQGGGDENLALVSKTIKGKGKVPSKKGNSEGEGSQPGKKKDLSKIKCFVCHKMGHYTSKCPEKNKGKGKAQQVAASTETHLSDLVAMFENDFSLVSCLSTSTIHRSAWYLVVHLVT